MPGVWCRAHRWRTPRSATTTGRWRGSVSGSRASGRTTCAAAPTTSPLFMLSTSSASGPRPLLRRDRVPDERPRQKSRGPSANTAGRHAGMGSVRNSMSDLGRKVKDPSKYSMADMPAWNQSDVTSLQHPRHRTEHHHHLRHCGDHTGADRCFQCVMQSVSARTIQQGGKHQGFCCMEQHRAARCVPHVPMSSQTVSMLTPIVVMLMLSNRTAQFFEIMQEHEKMMR